MHPDLHRYLDGELPQEALSPDLRIEAELWDSLLDDVTELRRDTAPPWLEDRVMAALPGRHRRRPRPGGPPTGAAAAGGICHRRHGVLDLDVDPHGGTGGLRPVRLHQ